MKTQTKTVRSSITELNLNTNTCTNRRLPTPRKNCLPLLKDRLTYVPGMAGFHFAFEENGDAALFHIGKGGIELVTGAVVWGQDNLLFDWLVGYRAAQWPWIPGGSVWTLPKISRCPWAAFLLHLGIATISATERSQVHQFHHHLVAAILDEKS
jgi:hypothetical protein